jgi:hypothetical protein
MWDAGCNYLDSARNVLSSLSCLICITFLATDYSIVKAIHIARPSTVQAVLLLWSKVGYSSVRLYFYYRVCAAKLTPQNRDGYSNGEHFPSMIDGVKFYVIDL